MKVKSMKGFTLAELLIVMAIVVVLASVAIPTFTRQLETSRETADVETLRNAYTEAYTMALKDVSADGALTEGTGDGKDTFTISGLKFVQTTAGFDYVSGSVGGLGLDDNNIKTIDQTMKSVAFTFAVATADSAANATPAYKKGDLYLVSATPATA